MSEMPQLQQRSSFCEKNENVSDSETSHTMSCWALKKHPFFSSFLNSLKRCLSLNLPLCNEKLQRLTKARVPACLNSPVRTRNGSAGV